MRMKWLISLILLVFVNVPLSVANEPKSNDDQEATVDVEIDKLHIAGFGEPEVKDITENIHDIFKKKKKNRKIKFTHGFDITLVMLKDSDWTEKVITKRMAKVMEIFGQCGVMITKAKLVMAHAPDNMGADLSNDDAFKLNSKFPLESNNVMYFQQTEEDGNLAYAYIKKYPAQGSVFNRSWITYEVATEKYAAKKRRYNVDKWEEVHELGHILLNEGHPKVERKVNLMNDRVVKYFGSVIDRRQCEKIRKDPYGVGIVRFLGSGPINLR